MTSRDAHFVVCPSDRLSNGQHLKLQLVFEALREECIVFRFEGKVYAYLNRCVHMPRKLDCEQSQVFDKSGRFLRCSMHGIVYQPETGASVSTICEGERLRSVALREADGEILITDFRVSSINAGL
jgi:nitrite reductase/ring-hydroxylating ferredoxin subunit